MDGLTGQDWLEPVHTHGDDLGTEVDLEHLVTALVHPIRSMVKRFQGRNVSISTEEYVVDTEKLRIHI